MNIDTVLLEKVAEAIHDRWMENKISQGYVWGQEVDQTLKTHPCLIPYHKLSEEQKKLDRDSALTTIEALHLAGYDVVPKETFW